MANHGAKFVSVNLNKSYGQQNQHSHHTHYPYSNGGGGSYGQAAAAGRGRPGSGGGGGMVVLSRNRGGPAKVVPKLSVPPPLNLPSLRKEHEKFDMSGSNGLGAGAGTGSGSRPSSSGVGWTKPVSAATAVLEKSEGSVDTLGVAGMDAMDGVTRAIGSYMPPSARSNGVGVVGSASVSQDIPPSSEKPVVLRGEDFPTLQAARPVSSGTSQKQKDGLIQKQKQATSEELTQDKRDSYHLGPLVDMNSLGHSSRNTGGSRLENGGEGHGMGSGQMADQVRKQEKYFPDPLPLVHMNPRSDWADDERDTGHVIVEQGRDIGFSNNESYWDRDFDLPRPSVLPHKPAQNQYDKWVQRDNETGKSFSSEVLKMDTYNKDVRAPSREGDEVNKWRSTPPYKDGFNSQVGNYRVEVGVRMAGHNNMVKENKYIPPRYGDTGRDGSSMLNQDSAFGRRDLGLAGRQQQQQRHNATESFNNRGAEHNSRDRHVTEQPIRYRGDNFRNNTPSKPSFAPGGKMAPMTDPILSMGRDKRFSKSDRPFSDDPFMRDFTSAGFDETDLFPGGLVGVIKRKKDAAKSTDFHDPVRESFEAELERVQKMQELERQRIIEEQERALEQARREEEERQRRIREEEERQRRLEEEAREAAWRVEQERLEAIRRAEEQRIAREEEKRRIQLEEERRKQAAKQMLQELEARMAKRQAEAAKGDASASKTNVDEKLEAAVKETHTSRNLDSDTWEDGERMVENVMTGGSFDSSAHSRPVEMSLRPYPPREGPSNCLDRGKAINSWRRDVFENGFPSPLSDQETGHYSPRRDAFGGGKATYRKEYNGGAGYMPSRTYLKPGVQEQYPDEFGYHKDHGWNLPGNAESYGKVREMEPEFNDSAADKYGDSGWGQGRLGGNTRPPYPERLYPHSEANELYSYGRSRYSMRQPRVLPPPSLASSQRTSFRGVTERSGPSAFLDNDIHYTHAARTESTRQTAYYGSNQGGLEPSEVFGLQQENSTSEDQKLNNPSRCDSQSSLSVSSPPTSPPHLSHDELDESGDSPVTSAVAEGKRSLLTGSGSVVHNGNSGNDTVVVASDSVSAVEDEEWTLENDDTMQQQEEYDEDEDGYREEEEVREADDENLELNQKFDGLGLEERESPHIVDNVVLGFDEGVEVVIPSDDFEKNSGTGERASVIPDTSVGVLEERRSSDGFPSDEHSLLPSDDFHGTSADSSSGKVPEKSPLQGSIGQPVSTPYSSSTADLLDVADSSNSTGLGAQQTVSSSDDVMATASQTNTPSLSSAGSQGDLPVKLQFGLFSGPSLIPSPVPAIQIGSIQMPLHIHPPVAPSITHMHPSQPPMFQFGQLHYSSPISQGVLPMAPQSMSFLQPNMLGQFNLTQNAGGSMTHEPARVGSTQNVTKDEVSSLSMNKQPSFVHASSEPEQSSRSLSQGLNTVLDAERHKDNSVVHSSSAGVSGASDNKMKSESVSQAEEKGRHHVVSKTYLPLAKVMGSEGQSQPVQPTMQSVAGDKNFSGLRGPGVSSGGRGKRFAYAVKNANMKSPMQDHDMPADSNGFQRRPRRTVRRTEFRVRNDRRPAPASFSSNNTSLDDKPNSAGKAVGVFTRSGSKRGTISNRTMKQRIESEPLASGNIISQEVKSEDREAKEMAKNLSSQTQNTSSHPGEANLRRNASEEDVDAPLQSGVVRVFKQPGIETPSDEDDFIEVRSKRQMLNDRREQREKEIKAKSRTSKPPSRPRATRQKVVAPRSHNKLSIPLGSEEPSNSQLDFTASQSPHFGNNVESVGFTAAVSKPQIGITAVNSEAQAIKPPQAGSVSVVSNGGKERDPGPMFDSKNKVMSLSQTQIDEAMKPARYDSHISAVGGHSSTASDPILPTASILTKEKTFSSGASPINSLLAGEKIQFGAVTSPTLLPPSSRVVSNAIGAPGSNRPDVQMSRSFPVPEKDNSLFFEKGKHLSDSCVPLQDCEAEAEAAASAVAVAAISSDEMAGNGLAVTDTKSFVGADIDSITTGVVGDQHLASQSRGEELLSVSLPADLSVETTPISLWPPLPSPQSSSSQMLSHFPGGPPSHFPFYEMNPLLGGPIFAFSPHEESSGTQSQPQKSTPSSSASLGNWQQCHSGVDSFYGPPAGYSGPFIGPPGGIPGVQGPPHMVVYNHFAPVGQYGQVGLSFMGTTYIPSGKQADWKNNPTSSAMHIGEGDINNMNMTNVQRNAPNMTAPVQHLAPGSPLLPMPSPLPMFDVTPFQTASDLPVQARWGHIPASPLHSVPVSRPLHPQGEGAPPSQVSHGHSIDQSLTAKRFTESRTPTPSDNSPSFTVAQDTNVAPFPSELGLVDSGSLRSTSSSSGQNVAVQSSSGSANAESNKTDTVENGKHQSASSVKTQFPQKNASIQQGNTAGYNYQRGPMSHRNNTGNEWSHRRMGFHGRTHSTGMDKGFPASKMKQIYVAKQTTSGSSTT
ncbi:hypothetical protein Salat_2445700 [Sesamum alatum]|uniref:Uncharacterized protein n=1 Tax=Sesamum alatum TaxID=300844 RepID=A0AAE1XRD4_9LAMI|nr:hypothetical protein Salat_2445700 [Sesamum alatum]